jgi:hypothetical protein
MKSFYNNSKGKWNNKGNTDFTTKVKRGERKKSAAEYTNINGHKGSGKVRICLATVNIT